MNFKFSLPNPTLILGAGISGSGKSTLLNPLAKALTNSVFIEKDLINYALLWTPKKVQGVGHSQYLIGDLVPRDDPSNTYYGDHVRYQSYHLMLMMAKQLLPMGKHPILEGNYIKEVRFGYIEKVLAPQLTDFAWWREGSFKLKIILAHADPEIIRKRVIERAAEHDKVKLSSDEEWKKHLEEQPPVPPEIEKYSHIKVETSSPITQKQYLEVVDYLSS
ncbi:AAA family ATPase [Candidatus Giovannonibacteria bacterium]|nr:AAA family ATPase [Candidatus Giovannonibacteria bacterium]